MNAKLMVAALSITALLGVTACGASNTKESTNPSSNSAPKTQSSTASKKETTPAKPATAKAIVDALKKAGMPIGKTDVYTASNDPNKLLGRPGEYTSKVNFVDTRVHEPISHSIDVLNGGSVEVFANQSDAKTRFDYVKNIVKHAPPALQEYDYRDGNVLLRISHDLTPSQEKAYESALDKVLS